jgi:hypothetical protein
LCSSTHDEKYSYWKLNQSGLKKIDAAFNETVSVSIERTLGPAVKKAIFSNLQRDFGINENNLAENPEKFVSGLERLFGPAGKDFLVKMISKDLIARFRLCGAKNQNTISEILEEIREGSCSH